MNDKPIMKCGHAANATHDGEPVCVICLGTGVGNAAREINTQAPSLEGRTARCSYAGGSGEKHGGGGQYRGQQFDSTWPSSSNLPFFSHRPDRSEDEFYCGCWGWD